MKKRNIFFRLAAFFFALSLVFALLSCGSGSKDDAETSTSSTVALPDEDSKSKISDGTFNYTLYKTYAEVSEYLGGDAVVIIPPSVEGLPLMSIGKSAFEYNKTITTVIMPDSLTNIGNYSFRGCTTLVSVNFPDGLVAVGNYAFVSTGLTDLIFPDSLTVLGKYCFAETKITKLTMPRYIAKTNDYMFCGCPNLVEFELPECMTKIANRMFYNCDALTVVTVPDFVTEIDDYAFSGCDSLTDIYIPATVTTLGEGVFIGSDNITIHTPAGSAAEIYASHYKISCDNNI